MQPNDRPPTWAMTIPAPAAKEGLGQPVAPVTAQAGLSDPDADGHQWILLMLGDGTVGMTLRIPWQSAAQFGSAVANMLGQLAAQAAARQGPQLIVPTGPIPDLIAKRLNGNGHGPN